MANYRCRYMTENGDIVENVLDMDSIGDIYKLFEERKYKVISIEEGKKPIELSLFKTNKLNTKSLVLFCRQMSTLLSAGVPLLQCFSILLGQSDDKLLKSTLSSLSTAVQEGTLLSSAMEKLGDRFPQLIIKMIEVGEATGNLPEIMQKLADKFENDEKIARKVKGALAYPIFLISVALIVCIFMLIVIVPKFVALFASYGSELPALTKMILNVSNFFRDRWYFAIAGAVALVIAIKKIFSIEAVQQRVDKIKLTNKILRGPMTKLNCEQFASTFHILLTSGIPIVHALEQTCRSMKNRYAQQCIEKVIIGMQQGNGISEQLSEFPIFPKMFISMISIGESSGKMNEMLKKTSDYYKEESEAAIASLMTLLEPLMVVMVGGLVAVIVVALYAPIFGLYGAVS